MLLKWIWRFGREREALRRRVICNKYEIEDRFVMLDISRVRSQACSVVVADIIHTFSSPTLVAKVFKEGLACTIGSGEGVRFLSDIWIGDEALQLRFPRVFALVVEKRAVVAEMGHIAAGCVGNGSDLSSPIF